MASAIEAERLQLPAAGKRHTHYLFRYPAKFHPPAVQALLDRYVPPEGIHLDNFCGSGTSLVEAAVSGRRSVGTDLDPVAVIVSLAKTRRYNQQALRVDFDDLIQKIQKLERSTAEYDLRTFEDIDIDRFEQERKSDELWVPEIPRLHHWFRKYVTIDLARTIQIIDQAKFREEPGRTLARLAFVSVLRNVSNADPVPVSGLEVTSHMLKKEAEGRRINPITHVIAALRKAEQAVAEYSAFVRPEYEPLVVRADATRLNHAASGPFDAVIASPPYHNAVDYYRRHQLEMYWLRLVRNHQDRLELLPSYIGRPRVPMKNETVASEWSPGDVAGRWYDTISAVDQQRATDLKHYIISMERVFRELSQRTVAGGPIVLVVGESSWRDHTLPTKDLLAEVANPIFELVEHLWYPTKNRYMSYTRRNGANIAHEHVLVFR